jgi:hypothetical protein
MCGDEPSAGKSGVGRGIATLGPSGCIDFAHGSMMHLAFTVALAEGSESLWV